MIIDKDSTQDVDDLFPSFLYENQKEITLGLKNHFDLKDLSQDPHSLLVAIQNGLKIKAVCSEAKEINSLENSE